jgi:PKHD-type hydroxylase
MKEKPIMSMQPEDTWKYLYYTWPDFFNKEEVEQICEFIENNYIGNEDPRNAAHNQQGSYKQVSSVRLIDYETVEPLISRLVKQAYQTANLDFGFITFGPHPGEHLLYNTYQSKDKDYYDWHFDNSKSPTYDLKLTLLVNLSTEPYEGGEFQTYIHSEENHPGFENPGSAMMFKGGIFHRVKPVTSGTRKSLVMFINGPKFR